MILGVLAFSAFLSHPFVFDDTLVIRDNTWLNWGHIPRFFSSFVFEPTLGFSGFRPLPLIFFSAIKEIFGLEPVAFRAVNLFIHICNAALVVVLTRQIHRTLSDRWAFLIGALYLLHPIQTNLIALAWNLCDLLFITGTLVSFIAFQRWAEEGENNRWWGLGLLGLVFAICAKENALILAPSLVLFERWFWDSKLRTKIRWLKFYIPLMVITFLHLWLLFVVKEHELAKAGIAILNPHPPSLQFGRLEYALHQVTLLPVYLQTILFPLHLYPYHYFDRTLGSMWIHTALGGLILVGTLTVLFFGGKRFKGWACAALFFLLFWMPGSTWVPLHLSFDEDRVALSLLGVLWCLPLMLGDKIKRPLTIVLVLIMALFVLRDRTQASHWKSAESLWQHNVEQEPRDPRAWHMLGATHEAQGRWDQAATAYAQAALAEPGFGLTHLALGRIYLQEGDLGNARKSLEQAENTEALEDLVWFQLGIVAVREKDLDGAQRLFRKSIGKNRKNVGAYRNLAWVLEKKGRFKEAVVELNHALAWSPADSGIKTQLQRVTVKARSDLR